MLPEKESEPPCPAVSRSNNKLPKLQTFTFYNETFLFFFWSRFNSVFHIFPTFIVYWFSFIVALHICFFSLIILDWNFLNSNFQQFFKMALEFLQIIYIFSVDEKFVKLWHKFNVSVIFSPLQIPRATRDFHYSSKWWKFYWF